MYLISRKRRRRNKKEKEEETEMEKEETKLKNQIETKIKGILLREKRLSAGHCNSQCTF